MEVKFTNSDEARPLSTAIEALLTPLIFQLRQAIDANDPEATHHYADTLAVLDRAYYDARYEEHHQQP